MIRIENTQDTLHFYVSGIMSDDSCKQISDAIKIGVEAGIKNVSGHLNTYGGSVAGAWDIISTIKSNNLHFTATNEGFAISAGAILLASANHSRAFDYSTSMIHDPMLQNKTLETTEGSARELLVAIKDGIMAIFSNRIKVAKDVLYNMLKKETSWNASDQLKYGLVDEILYTSTKPNILKNELNDYKLIYNIIEEFNTNNNINELIIKNMTQEEIDALVQENETLKAKIIELETKISETTPEVVIEDETAVVEPENPVKEECSSEEMAMKNELTNLKVENFVLKNKLEEKSEMIENAVKLHGVEVLNTIFAFINNDSKALETKVEELQNTIVTIANKANDEIQDIINNTGGKTVDYEKMAEDVFGMKADGSERLRIKNENPELHEKLFNIYYGITEQ